MKQSSPRNCLTHTMEVVTDSGEISPENMGGGMAKEDGDEEGAVISKSLLITKDQNW